MSSLFARRIVAYGADCLLLFAVLAPLGGAVQWALGVVPTDAPALYGTLLLNFSLPAWAYFVWGDRSRRGATWGARRRRAHRGLERVLALDPLHGVLDKLVCGVQIQLVLDASPVGLDGFDGEVEPVGNLAGGRALAR